MTIDEILGREDYSRAICDSFAEGWTEQFGTMFAVHRGRRAGAQQWTLQGLLSVFHTGPLGPIAREFASDLIRYTSVRRRQYLQWLLGTVRGSSASIRLLGRPAFFVEPAVPRSNEVLLLPGNRRHRVVDFKSMSSRVMLKSGFDPSAIEREVAIRSAPTGPFVTLTAWGKNWFEEPLFPGRPLNRWTSAGHRERWRQRAWQELASWTLPTEQPAAAESYVADLLSRARSSTRTALVLYPGLSRFQLSRILAQLAEAAVELPVVKTAIAHGDFQAGNIMVNAAEDLVVLSDWEYSGRRMRDYDFFVYALGLRHPNGISKRFERFAATGEPLAQYEGMSDYADPTRRRAALALALLEDLTHLLGEAVSGPYLTPPAGLIGLLQEIALPAPAPPLRWLL